LAGGEELLVPQVDRGEAAGRELLLGRLQAGLEVVEPLVDGLDVAAGGHDLRHVQPGHALDVVGRERREGIDDGHGDGVGGLGDGHQAVAPGERPGQGLGHDVEVQVERVDLHVGQAGVGGQGLGDLDLAGQAELDHRLLRVTLLTREDRLARSACSGVRTLRASRIGMSSGESTGGGGTGPVLRCVGDPVGTSAIIGTGLHAVNHVHRRSRGRLAFRKGAC
jgi:hypothetical protein